MSAQFESGFSVREPMWHGLGFVPDRHPETPEEAQTWAGALWQVEKRDVLFPRQLDPAARRQLHTDVIRAVLENQSFTGRIDSLAIDAELDRILTLDRLGAVNVPGKMATFRTDTQAPLGFVSPDYEVVQNDELFKFVHALLSDQTDEVEFETGGVLCGGAIVWASCSLPGHDLLIPGTDDLSRLYVSSFTGHDGRHPFSVTIGKERIVCWNTFRRNLANNVARWSVRHVGDALGRVEEARQALGLALKWDEEFNAIALHLAETPMSDADWAAYSDLLLPLPGTLVSDRVRQNAVGRREKLEELYVEQWERPASGGDFRAIKGTRWAALQAATEYYDWHTRVLDTTGDGTSARRLLRTMVEGEDLFKSEALDCLLAPDLPAYVEERLAV